MNVFCIWRRGHEREQDRETYTTATAKGARARPGGAIARPLQHAGSVGCVGSGRMAGLSGIEAWQNLLRHTFEFTGGGTLLTDRSIIYMDGMDCGPLRRAGHGDRVDSGDIRQAWPRADWYSPPKR